MARRKEQDFQGYSSDSGDEQEEDEDYPTKKRRLNREDAKASAWEGVFGDEVERPSTRTSAFKK